MATGTTRFALDRHSPLATFIYLRLLRNAFADRAWNKHIFEIKKTVDGVEKESISHEVDHVKDFSAGALAWKFALEIEWNNKDPFFDRDLENFKRLHADGVISIGAVITRGTELQGSLEVMICSFAQKRNLTSVADLKNYYNPTSRQVELIHRCVKAKRSFAEGWAHAFVSDKFGEATTHWRKLEDRVKRGVGNPCPLLLIGLPQAIVNQS